MNTLTHRDAIIEAHLVTIREQHRAISRFVFRRMLLSAFAFLSNTIGAFFALRFSPVLGLILFFAGSFVHYCVVFRVLPMAAEALCHRTGFVCPYCNKPLRTAGTFQEELLQKGECPSCFQRIEPPFQTSKQAGEL